MEGSRYLSQMQLVHAVAVVSAAYEGGWVSRGFP